MTKLDKHYTDPRLVNIYDMENSHRTDIEFYLSLANEVDAHRIIDFGCGTGFLTRKLATADRHVIGVDPATTMVGFARRQSGAEKVEWIEGDASALGTPQADLLFMTGNVSQIFLEDSVWMTTLKSIYAALRPGGYFAFESRNPEDQGWKRWNRKATYSQYNSPHGPVESWLELVNVEGSQVRFEGHYIFIDANEVIVVESELRFRSRAEIVNNLTDTGFTVEHVYGDWKRGPLEENSRAMVFVARRPQSVKEGENS